MGIGRRQWIKLGFVFAGAGLATAAQRLTSAGEQKGDGAKPADAKAMEAWWLDLEKDEPKSSMALLKFADRPDDSVAFFKERLKPLKLDKDRLKDLLGKLANEDEAVWVPAFEELDYYDPRLATDLETLMDEVVDAPARQRMVAVLSGRAPESLEGKTVNLRKVSSGGHNFYTTPGGSWWAEADVTLINARSWVNPKVKWTRNVRAIVLLEHFGSPAAIAILKDMAAGHPFAQPTRAAEDALRRLGVKRE
jgi:hypothetical protein